MTFRRRLTAYLGRTFTTCSSSPLSDEQSPSSVPVHLVQKSWRTFLRSSTFIWFFLWVKRCQGSADLAGPNSETASLHIHNVSSSKLPMTKSLSAPSVQYGNSVCGGSFPWSESICRPDSIPSTKLVSFSLVPFLVVVGMPGQSLCSVAPSP